MTRIEREKQAAFNMVQALERFLQARDALKDAHLSLDDYNKMRSDLAFAITHVMNTATVNAIEP